jgi:hypothetical protein
VGPSSKNEWKDQWQLAAQIVQVNTDYVMTGMTYHLTPTTVLLTMSLSINGWKVINIFKNCFQENCHLSFILLFKLWFMYKIYFQDAKASRH